MEITPRWVLQYWGTEVCRNNFHSDIWVASVENNSKGDCKIHCLSKLTYSILGSGNIYLTGNPPEIIKLEESSTGQLIQ